MHEVRGTVSRTQVVLLVNRAAMLALSVAIIVVVGRALDAASFGVFALVTVVFTIGRELTDLGATAVAARAVSRAPREEADIVETLLGWRRRVTTATALACAALAFTADGPAQAGVFLAAAVVVSFQYVHALSAVFLVRQSFVAVSLFTVATQAVMLGACLALATQGVPGITFAALAIAREVVMLIGIRAIAMRELGHAACPRLHPAVLRYFTRASLLLGGANVLYNCWLHSGTFLVWLFRSQAELGAYAAGFRPILPLMGIGSMLMFPMLPHLTRFARADRSAFTRHVAGNLQLCAGLGLVAAVGGAVLAPALVEALYGSRYVGGDLSAIATFRWQAVALGFATSGAALVVALLADGRERTLLGIATGGIVVNLAANALLLPRMAFAGAAVSSAITEACVLVALVWACRGLEPARSAAGGLVSAVAPGLVLVPILFALPGTTAVQVIAGGLLGTLAALAVWFMPGQRHRRAELAAADRAAGPAASDESTASAEHRNR